MQIPSTAAYLRKIGEIAPNVRVSDLTNVTHYRVPEAKGASKNASNPPFVSGLVDGNLRELMLAADRLFGIPSRIGAPEEIVPRGIKLNA